MVVTKVDKTNEFVRIIKRIKDNLLKHRIERQTVKIIENPKIGKPMKYTRKGTRELYIGSFRICYVYLEKENKIIFLDLYHKDEQ